MPISINPDILRAAEYPYLAITTILSRFDVATGKTQATIVYQKFAQVDPGSERIMSPMGNRTVLIADFDAFAADKASAGDVRFAAMGMDLMGLCAELAKQDDAAAAAGGTN